MKALIVVDAQNDFMPGGSLAVPEGDQIVQTVNKLIDEFDDDRYPIFFTRDAHPANHGSFASEQGIEPFTMGELSGDPQMLWPDHCIVGTRGFEICGSIETPLHTKYLLVDKGMDPKRDSYSGFADAGGRATELLMSLVKLGVKTGDELYICGLATDYCVKATALDAARLGFKVRVILDACRGVAAESMVRAIYEMLATNIDITAHRWM